MRRFLVVAGVLAASAGGAGVLASCARDAPQVGQVITVRGQVHMQGNDPFPVAVLDPGNGQPQWELRGLSRGQVRTWQARPATVTGRVLRLPGGNAALGARLEVQDIH